MGKFKGRTGKKLEKAGSKKFKNNKQLLRSENTLYFYNQNKTLRGKKNSSRVEKAQSLKTMTVLKQLPPGG